SFQLPRPERRLHASIWLPVAAKKPFERRVRECPLWVKSRHVRCTRPCPLYPESGHGSVRSGAPITNESQTVFRFELFLSVPSVSQKNWLRMRLLPQISRDLQHVDIGTLPPSRLISSLVQLPMMAPT